MPITLVLPSWKLKPNGDIAHVMTHNNTKIAEIVGLTSEKEFREYFGNDMRITPSGLFGIYDFIGNISGCDRDQTRKKVLRTPYIWPGSSPEPSTVG